MQQTYPPTSILSGMFLDEIEISKQTGRPFAETQAMDDYFIFTNRIDSTFVQGHLARRDRNYSLLYDLRERYSYLFEFYQRKKVYFTFGRINLYQLQELYPNHSNPLLFTLKRLDLSRQSR